MLEGKCRDEPRACQASRAGACVRKGYEPDTQVPNLTLCVLDTSHSTRSRFEIISSPTSPSHLAHTQPTVRQSPGIPPGTVCSSPSCVGLHVRGPIPLPRPPRKSGRGQEVWHPLILVLRREWCRWWPAELAPAIRAWQQRKSRQAWTGPRPPPPAAEFHRPQGAVSLFLPAPLLPFRPNSSSDSPPPPIYLHPPPSAARIPCHSPPPARQYHLVHPRSRPSPSHPPSLATSSCNINPVTSVAILANSRLARRVKTPPSCASHAYFSAFAPRHPRYPIRLFQAASDSAFSSPASSPSPTFPIPALGRIAIPTAH